MELRGAFVVAAVVLGLGTSSAHAAAEGQEMVYRRSVKDLAVTLRVRPGAPSPNRVATLLFELNHRAKVELDGSDLVAVVTSEGGEPSLGSFVVHSMRQPGLYGMHLTAPRAGVYRIQVSQRSRKSGPAVSFDVQVGIGVPTPMPAESAAAPSEPPPPVALGDLMEGMGDLWDDLLNGLKDPHAKPAELTQLIKRIGQVPPKVVGQGRFPEGTPREEFDQLARKLGERVNGLAGMVNDPARAKAEVLDIENTVCLRCHTKYRFEITRDVKSWPQFQPVEPSPRGQQPGR